MQRQQSSRTCRCAYSSRWAASRRYLFNKVNIGYVGSGQIFVGPHAQLLRSVCSVPALRQVWVAASGRQMLRAYQTKQTFTTVQQAASVILVQMTAAGVDPHIIKTLSSNML